MLIHVFEQMSLKEVSRIAPNCYKMVKTAQFTTKCKGDRVIALKRQKSLWWDSA